ncbi:hypothetical protein CTAYLR_002765 [Chrysophaeum taylorii]|uniref:DEK-C domain-containing protein n=1 Tax=Chrysophaeum taylorii TaxID=2483200 RepID=A0AAD7XKT9_9STRA|nr:hypothetical protein CTAYLR_002765 [Chrysophaeum taylorii]
MDDDTSLRDAVGKVLKKVDPATTGLREIRRLVETELGLAPKACDARKDEIRRLVLETSPKKKKRARNDDVQAAKKTKKEETATKPVENEEDDERVRQLKMLARAMGTGPSVYRGLGNMDVEAKVKALTERLRERGAEFQAVPTAKDIARAKSKRAKQLDLDGMDASNILESGERRSRRQQVVVVASPRNNKTEPDDDDLSESEFNF